MLSGQKPPPKKVHMESSMYLHACMRAHQGQEGVALSGHCGFRAISSLRKKLVWPRLHSELRLQCAWTTRLRRLCREALGSVQMQGRSPTCAPTIPLGFKPQKRRAVGRGGAILLVVC